MCQEIAVKELDFQVASRAAAASSFGSSSAGDINFSVPFDSLGLDLYGPTRSAARSEISSVNSLTSPNFNSRVHDVHILLGSKEYNASPKTAILSFRGGTGSSRSLIKTSKVEILCTSLAFLVILLNVSGTQASLPTMRSALSSA